MTQISHREKRIINTSWAGVAVNLTLSAFKAATGLIANSIAIVLDAINNLSDAFSATVTIIGMKVAGKPADKEHPYGHGRAEYFTAVVIAAVIIVAGVTSFIESSKKIIHPEPAEYTTATLIVLVTAILAKIFLGRWVKKVGEEVNSESLVATGADALFDALITSATLVAALCGLFFGDKIDKIPIDGILGALISLVIMKAGYEMIMKPINELMGERIPAGLTKAIKADICMIPPVLGAYDLQLHNYGPEQIIGAVNIAIPEEMTAKQIHFLAQKIKETIQEKYGVLLTIGIYAVITADREIVQMQESITSMVEALPGVLQAHGMFIDLENKRLSFDIVIDFSVKDIPALKKNIAEGIEKRFPGFSVQVHIDKDYSD